MNEILTCLHRRRSVRAFTGEPVTAEEKRTILEAAVQAPTAGNQQLYTILDIMSKTGSIVFDNLALLFAMGVAIGMAKKEKEVAALSGAIAYLIMNTAISTLSSDLRRLPTV